MAISDLEIAWLAGILEGEGYFASLALTGSPRRKPTRKYPAIILAMTDEDIVQRVANMWGTRVGILKARKSHHKLTYRCLLRGTGAAEWMERVKPYLGARRFAKVDEILHEWYRTPLIKKPRIKRNPGRGFL